MLGRVTSSLKPKVKRQTLITVCKKVISSHATDATLKSSNILNGGEFDKMSKLSQLKI